MALKTSNTEQAFWIALGSLFSFGFGIMSSVILSRYLPKADYGTYKQVLYVYSTLVTIFTLGLPKAFSYFLPRAEIDQAKSVIRKITNLFFLLGAVFSILLFIFSPQIASVLNNPDLEMALRIFSPVPFLMLPTMGLEGILATFRMTQFMAIYTIATRIFMLVCVALPVLLLGGGYIQAIIGFSVASSITFLLALYLKYLPVKNQGNDQAELRYKEIFSFSLPLLIASLWGTLIRSTDQFFISRYFGQEDFAEFSNGFMDLPFKGMIVGATATVLSPIFSRLSHQKVDPQKEIYPLWISVFEKSAMLIYPLLIYTIILADVLMIFLYGVRYENSAIYYQIYNLSNFFQIIVFAPLIINIGKVRFYQNVHMVSALLLIPAEYLSLYLINSPYGIAATSTIFTIGRSMVMLLFVSNYFRVKLYKLFPIALITKIVVLSVVILIPVRYILENYFQINPIQILLLSFTIYTIIYLLISRLIKMDYKAIIRPLLGKFIR